MSFFGAAFVTDESPPSGNRYTGLRFQITWLYVPFFKDVAMWEAPEFDDKYPMVVKKLLCDVMNVTQKTGRATFDIIRRQIDRLGLSEYDMVNGVGDGGGENEGTQGVHALFEEADPLYVRRRCAPHFAWRTFDAGTRAMGAQYKKGLALNNYLRDGVTWARLKAIAVQSREEEGLDLMDEGGHQFAFVFRNSPPRLIDERPQATLDFFKWLLPREHVLKLLISQDMRLRNLGGADAVTALETVNASKDAALRRIDTVLMHKSMYMFYFVKKYENTVACADSFEQVIDKASDIITSTACDDDVIDILGLTGVGLDTRTAHWVEAALTHMPGLSRDECEAFMQDAMDYHTHVAMAIASHMRLTAANILRPAWAAGAMLSKMPQKAQTAAAAFQDNLMRKPEGSRTPFEREFLNNEVLVEQLDAFVNAQPPQLLWRGNGQYKDLFICLGARFLAAPDHVLDAEGTHALWKWLETTKRGMNFRMLNCILRLQCYLRSNGRQFPDAERLEQLIVQIRQMVLADARDLGAENVGNGMHARLLYQRRFNLGPMELNLIRHANAANNPIDKTADVAWGNYVRFLFAPNAFYQFTALSDTLYLYVARNRAAPGRQQIAEGDATGRYLTYAWFQLAEEATEFAEDGIVVAPVAGDDPRTLSLRNATIAELFRAAGLYLPPEGSARDMELHYERAFPTLNTIRFSSARHGDSRMYWYFQLTEPVDIEEYMFATRPAQDVTKMTLARRLQILDGTDDRTRTVRWELTKDALFALLIAHGEDAGDAGDAGEGADEVPGDLDAPRGRGRGRAKAKGRGGGGRGRGGRGRGGRGRRGGGGRGEI